MNIQKCAIVGCGAVGATAAYTLLGSGLFNELVLIDINQKKAEGEAMDIGHGVPFIHPVEIYAGTYEDLADAYLVIVTAGANQLPGESRINLTEKNVRIFQSIIPEIVRYNTECLLLIVANPVDILTTVALRLSGFPPERVIGSGTVLDSSRFKYRLGEYIGIDHRNVHAFIIGEHGDSEVAVWSSATVSGIAVRDFCDELGIVFTREQMDEIVRDVKNSAYEIIEKKGATFYAVALAIRRIAEALIRDEHSLLTVSGYCSGAYEIEDVCIGLAETASNAMMYIIVILLGTSVGATTSAEAFLNWTTIKIVALGLIAFAVGTTSGVLFGKIMCKVTGGKVNPLIGSAGVSAVPMAARVSQKVGAEEDPTNFLLMHAMGPNVAGVIGTAVAAGVFMAIFGA